MSEAYELYNSYMPKTAKSGKPSSIAATDARDQFADLINRVAYGKDRILLTRRARPVAAIVPLDDLRVLEELEDRADREALRRAQSEVKRKGAIPWTTLKQELGLD
ncbi:MAG TPA: type II toxin-antitoxin system Phd/YefM family antitoxin [Candidatus Binataceae bacterium]|nr:type II toxin-antitoxin system Phd/YefM family antitoxin [Candidatus Binataceae bacterium]